MPNVEQPSYLTIFGVPPGGQTLVVQGDASYSSIATRGATYRVILGQHRRWYNEGRIHSGIGYMTQKDYAAQQEQAAMVS